MKTDVLLSEFDDTVMEFHIVPSNDWHIDSPSYGQTSTLNISYWSVIRYEKDEMDVNLTLTYPYEVSLNIE
jgi:hypothetical protein